METCWVFPSWAGSNWSSWGMVQWVSPNMGVYSLGINGWCASTCFNPFEDKLRDTFWQRSSCHYWGIWYESKKKSPETCDDNMTQARPRGFSATPRSCGSKLWNQACYIYIYTIILLVDDVILKWLKCQFMVYPQNDSAQNHDVKTWYMGYGHPSHNKKSSLNSNNSRENSKNHTNSRIDSYHSVFINKYIYTYT